MRQAISPRLAISTRRNMALPGRPFGVAAVPIVARSPAIAHDPAIPSAAGVPHGPAAGWPAGGGARQVRSNHADARFRHAGEERRIALRPEATGAPALLIPWRAREPPAQPSAAAAIR